MAIQKFARVEEILEIKSSPDRLPYDDSGALARFAALTDGMAEEDGYLYVRCRAISSRVNKNNDGWPSAELAAAYGSFKGRPIFVDHNNDNPNRTRGVIVDSKLHVDDYEKTSALDPYYANAPENHTPPTWIELLLEVDSQTYPKLAKEIKEGRIDAVSMGANIDRSVCSVCANEASSPSEYCSHVRQKGIEFEIESSNGEKVRKKSYEDCYGINFFEISFVFDPADPTADVLEHSDAKLAKTAADVPYNLEDFIEPAGTEHSQDDRNYIPQDDLVTAPQKVDTLRDEMECPVCHADDMQVDPDGIRRCPTCGHVQEPEPLNNPDLSEARDTDLRQKNQVLDNEDGQNEVPAEEDQVEIKPAVQPAQPTNNTIAAGVISEMTWTTVLSTTLEKVADGVLPPEAPAPAPTPGAPAEGGQGQETTVGFAGGIHFGTHQAFQQAGLSATVTYPAVQGDNVNQIPGNPIKDFMLAKKSMDALGLQSPAEVPIIVNSSDPQKAIEIIHSGGMGGGAGAAPAAPAAPGAGAPPTQAATVKKPLLPTGASDQPKETIVSDQAKPVEAAVVEANKYIQERDGKWVIIQKGTGKVLSTHDSEEKANESFRAMEMHKHEGSLEKTADCNKCGHAECDGNCADCPECKAEKEAAVAAQTEASEKKLLAAFALADEMVELQMLDKNEKMAFIAQLEEETLVEIEARQKTLSRVKEAGLKKAAAVVEHTGVRRVPRLAHHVVAASGDTSLDNIPDEAIFGGI